MDAGGAVPTDEWLMGRYLVALYFRPGRLGHGLSNARRVIGAVLSA